MKFVPGYDTIATAIAWDWVFLSLKNWMADTGIQRRQELEEVTRGNGHDRRFN